MSAETISDYVGQLRAEWGLYPDDAARLASLKKLNPDLSDADCKLVLRRAEKDADKLAKATTADAQEQEDKHRETDREAAARLATAVDLWHSPDGTAFASIDVNGHTEHVPVRGARFKFWLVLKFRAEKGKAPSTDALSIAQTEAEAIANMTGEEYRVPIRIAHHEGRVYVDLCDTEWRAVEIDAQGWRVVTNPPVRFRRTNDMEALPVPVPGGSLGSLRPFVNAESDADWGLMVAFLLGTLSDGPYPILALNGSGGSAKSSTARFLRRTVDPAGTLTRRRPRQLDDLAIAAKWSAVLVFDNLSGLSADLSDALCTLSTGDGVGKRTLYADDAETLFYAKRPIILTGIQEMVTRGDLLSRTIVLQLPPIDEQARRTEHEMDARWEQEHPAILGALLDVVSAALRNRDRIAVPNGIRMADFAQWVMAAAPALGWSAADFLDAYAENRAAAQETELEASPFCSALIGFMENEETATGGQLDRERPQRREWSGTASELLAVLTAYADSEQMEKGDAWPKTALTVRGRINSHAAALRSAGLSWESRKSDNRRVIDLELAP